MAGTRAYQPYGAPLESAGVVESVYGFTGEQTDPTGLLYLRARYYSPYVGLFQSLDPWKGFSFQPQTLHGYTYVLNNPATFSDPRGLLCILGFGNCDEEYDLFTLPYRFLPNDFCLPGGFGCWGGDDYTDWLEKEYFPNLPADEFVDQLSGRSRVTEFYPFPCQEGPNNWDAWKVKHDLTSWLVTQMKVNAAGSLAEEVRFHLRMNNPPELFEALLIFGLLVRPGGIWDFKPDIGEAIGTRVVLGNDWYYYDVPGNIHFGYVGVAIGFDPLLLHAGAGVAQIGGGAGSDLEWWPFLFDSPEDHEALQLGMNLYSRYGPGLTEGEFITLLEEHKFHLDMEVAPIPPGYDIP